MGLLLSVNNESTCGLAAHTRLGSQTPNPQCSRIVYVAPTALETVGAVIKLFIANA